MTSHEHQQLKDKWLVAGIWMYFNDGSRSKFKEPDQWS
jgi:hypothetical protein